MILPLLTDALFVRLMAETLAGDPPLVQTEF
jgi:hypothetical protein